MRTLTLALLLGGCAKTSGEAPEPTVAPVAVPTGTLTPVAPTTTAAPAPAAPDARWAALAARLRARHADDLPDRAALLAIPDAEAALLWIADHDRSMAVRARALGRLGVLAPPDAVDVLAGWLADPTRHAALRAGAVHGLALLGPTPGARAVLEAARDDADPQVAAEVAAALAAPAIEPAP